MIKRLKRRVILLVAAGLFGLLFLIVLAINIINFRSVMKSADEVLDIIAENGGVFPDTGIPPKGEQNPDRLPPDMSPEVPYESRFFTVLIDRNGRVTETDTGRIASVDGEAAENYAVLAYKSGVSKAFLGSFRFVRTEKDDNTLFIFLDCGRRLESYGIFLLISVGISLLALLLVLVIVILLADRIIRPISESYEKQKRFITDAGHEIKTPLAIISANTDLIEMEFGESESCTEIRNQTKRLGELTADLVQLAKMEEAGSEIQKIEFPFSDVVEEIAAEYRAPALTGKKTLRINVEGMISVSGNEKMLRKLVSLLMDNALKYSPEESEIELSLSSRPLRTILSITNRTKERVEPHELERIFDRFYRTDSSRNSETGGHGIGLSLARAIVLSHGGRITASTKDGSDFTVTVQLPGGAHLGIIKLQ